MKRLIPMFDNSGARYSIPEDRVDEFRADMGEVAEAKRYRGKDGRHYTIPQDQDEAFRADMPDAVPVRSYTMADGSRRDFTMSEMSKFLRSKEYRESEDYAEQRKALESQIGSSTWAGVKGALTGAAEGAYEGASAASNAIAKALPEVGIGLESALGNAINLGGNAKNAVGDWLVKNAAENKAWLDAKLPSEAKAWTGYEDWSTKTADKFGEMAAMTYKFAPGMSTMGAKAFMETVFASDGMNAAAQAFDRAKSNVEADGVTPKAVQSDAAANLEASAAFLVNYFGGKFLMKGGAAAEGIKNPALRWLASGAATSGVMAEQSGLNKVIENVGEGKPISEGVLPAMGEGAIEGAIFHGMNALPGAIVGAYGKAKQSREQKAMLRESTMTALESGADGRNLLATLYDNDGVDAAIRARKEGKDVSRKMGAAADLPDNMSAAERNAVIDGISKAREAQAERIRTKMDDVQAQSLADEIGQNLMGGASDPMFEDIWLNATRRVKDATELDEPGARARIVGEAIEEVAGREAAEGGEQRKVVGFGTEAEINKENAYRASRRASLRGQEQKAQRKAELDEYERQEQERIEREKADQDAQMSEDERARAGQLIAEGAAPNVPVRESSEYKAWLRKRGRTDTDKNFNRYVAERGLDASLKVERGHNGPNEQTKAELEMGRRIEAQGEEQRANAQSKYDEEMTRREEAKAKAARAAKEKQVADDWAAAEADRKAKAQDASRKGQEERARRKAEMAEYEFGEEIRKAREAEEERGEKPSISVGEREVVPPSADSRMKDYPEYASWIKKQGRVNNDKNWNKFVLSNGLDQRLTVERNRGPKLPEKPTPPELRVEKPKKQVIEADLTEKPQNPAEVDKKTPENAEKVPDGRGKMVEKPQSRQSDENGPTRAPQEKGIMSRPEGAERTEARNGATDAKVKGDKLGRTQSQIDEDNRIVADYDTIADAPNVINGDSIRKNMKVFKNDDTGTHHALTPRSTEIREKLFEKKLKDRKGKGSGSPNEVLFTMGGGGSGKSTASKGLSEEVDFTYDSTGANLNDMRDKISRVIANGQKPKVLFVYCDPKTAWGRVASRTEKGGHAVSENDFAGVHAQAIRNFDALRNEFGDAIIPFVIDNRGEIGNIKFIKADEFSKLPRYTKKEILDVITGRSGEGSRGAGGAQEPSGKRGQVNQPATVRVPDGKGRMVTKPAPVSKTESAAKPDGNGVYEKIANAELPIGLHPKFKRQNADEIAKIGVLAKDGKMPVSINGVDGGASKPNYVEFKYDDGSSQKVYGDINSIKKWADGVGLKPTASVRPAPAAQAEGVTAEALLERAKTDPELRRLDEAQKRAKTPEERNALLAKAQERIGELRKEMEAESDKAPTAQADGEAKPKMTLQEAESEIRKFLNGEEGARAEDVVAQFGPEKAQRILGTATKDFKSTTASNNRVSQLQKYIENKMGKIGPSDNRGSFAGRQKTVTEIRKRFDAERDAAMKPLDDALREIANGEEGSAKKWDDAKRARFDELLGKGKLTKGEMDELAILVGGPNGSRETIEVPLGKTGSLKVRRSTRELIQVRQNLHERYGKEASKRYYEIDTATPPQKLADPDFKAWARKQGRTPTDGARRIYDAQRVDSVLKVAKNWLKGVTMRRTENAAEVPNGARMLYSKDGNVVGWYDRAKKEVVTLPGADAATVAHELGWHATYDYAQAEAAQGRTALLDKLTDYANNAPQSVKNEVLRKYGLATDPAVLLDEIGAARYTMDNVNKIKDAADRRQAAKWYQRTWNAIADTYKAMLSKMGWNKARLYNLSALTPEQTVNLLADEMLKGKTLGKMKSSQIDMSKGETVAQLHDRKLKDRLRPVEEIESEAGKDVSNSAHTLFRLLPGKVQGAIDKAQNFAAKVKADCKAAGIKIDELNEFLYASAASERNAKVLARNGRLDGSAMSHADIQRILTAYRNSPKYAELRRIADEVLAFQSKGFDFRRKSGLISDDTWNTLLADEPNHVPMKSRFDPNGEHMGFSLTEQFGKPEWKSAEGRTNIGDGPLEWIVQEYVDAFSRGHENFARRALLETVLAHPEVGEVKKLGPNDALGEVKRKGQQGDPNVFIVKTDGDTYQVKLNGTRGEIIARAVSGRGLMRMDWTNAKIPHTEISVRNAMRWWSSSATSWSPTFAGRNFLADTIDVFAVNVGENGLIKGSGTFGKHVYTALKLTNAIRKYASTGETTNPLIREAVDAGVLMGGGVRGQAFADAGEAALKTLKTDWGNGRNRVKAVRNAMFGWIYTLNQTAELMNRMADYKLQREAGKGKNEAALHAREITVDFNEKGEITPFTNLFYMFSNSTLGANMRLSRAIYSTKGGKSLAAGFFVYGLIEGAVEAMANGDDEDGKNMNEYTRANSFYFRSGKNVFRIPLHASQLSVIKYAGNCTARKLFGTLNGDKAAEQIAKDMIGIMTSYLGIGALGDNEAASIAPTIVQPFIQAYMNRDFADRPIERTSFSEEKPKSGNGRQSTPQFYKDLAKWLNEFGGGNAGRKGELNLLGEKIGTDFSPEMLKHFAEATGKNTLRDIENTVEFAKMVLGKTEWDRRNIPVVRDYFRTTGGNDNRYFEAVLAYRADAEDFKQRTGSDKSDFMKSHPWLREGNDGKTTVNRLINMTNRDNPRSGIGSMGITQLRKLTEGKVRHKDGSYFEPNTPISDELKEKAREMLQKRQARVIEIMGK